MELLKGKLEYLGWLNRPWKLFNTKGIRGVTDLWPFFEEIFHALNGKEAVFDYTAKGFGLKAKASAETVLKYSPGESLTLEKKVGFGISNMVAYIEMALMILNGRSVIVRADAKKGVIKLDADPKEKVFGLYFTDGNSCRVPEGKENSVCKVGQADACVFSSFTAGVGFTCEKFASHTARLLLDRVDKDTIRARRIGNCALLGSKEDPEKEKRKAEAAAERFKKFCDGKLVGRKVRHRETMPTFVAEGIVKSLTIEDGTLVLRAGWDFDPSIAVQYAAAEEHPDGSVEICSVGFAGGNTWEFSPPS